MISLPLSAIEPERLSSSPMIAFRVVVLPAPLRPSSVTTSPARTLKSIPCRILDSPYQAWRLPTVRVSAMRLPRIGGHHVGARRDLGIASFRQHFAAHHHGDGVGELGDYIHVVLDQQYRAALAGLADQLRHAPDIFATEPRHTL